MNDNPTVEPGQDVATQTTALVPVETRAIQALNSTKAEVEIAALVAKHKGITEIKNKAGREQAHGAAMELMRARTSIKKVADDARDDAKKFNAAVLAEEKRLTALVEPEEIRIKKLRDDWDAAETARKEAEAAKERARLLAISEKIDSIRAYAKLASDCRTAARVQAILDRLIAEWATLQPLEDSFQEFAGEAQAAHDATHASITTVLTAKKAAEAEQARIKAEQEATAARLQAEADAVAAAAKKLADERAAFEAEQAAFRAAQAAAAPVVAAPVVDAPAPVAEAQAGDADPDDGIVDHEVTAQAMAGFAVATPAPQPAPEPAPAQRVTHFGRAPRPAPVAAPVTAPAPLAEVAPASRPSDEAIIQTLSLYYRVHESKVIEWLLDIDLDAATARMAQEFA